MLTRQARTVSDRLPGIAWGDVWSWPDISSICYAEQEQWGGKIKRDLTQYLVFSPQGLTVIAGQVVQQSSAHVCG